MTYISGKLTCIYSAFLYIKSIFACMLSCTLPKTRGFLSFFTYLCETITLFLRFKNLNFSR
ncbi:hypothetical protein C2G38_2075780 [Gigaspora rosea]|uniref:Uncharacterized protein n=1 Tax=Gigaspora rosea TaxID=44941 RepID=A0A397VIR1_9GLOM|nr:hypothetical protein C2G38_2075780 [Gigaspora rosea]